MPWVGALGAGTAVLLAGTPVTSIVQGTAWAVHAGVVVAAVVGAGLLLHRAGAAVVVAGQLLAAGIVLTVMFGQDRLLGIVPTPGTARGFGVLLADAGAQIDVGTAPVPATPEILFLVTAAFGLLAVAVHLAAVSARAPAAAGVPLLAVYAVPASLTDTLLPWWAMASAAAGFGLLLLIRVGERHQYTAGTAVVASAVVLALGIGAGGGFIGTTGRFDAGAGGAGGSIGLSPFTALRGQLDQGTPVELFRVRGLPRATYLRALTLREFVPDTGWKASSPEAGGALPGPIDAGPTESADIADIEIENVSFRDYWLPLYGRPLAVTGLPEGQWAFDARSATAYTTRPRQDDTWRERADLAVPDAATLRAAGEGAGPEAPVAAYRDVEGVDPRVGELARRIVADSATDFDRAIALQNHFTGPGSGFSYSLQTAAGGGDDALVEFLTVGRTGYCEQYASAMAVMLRTVGVPARVAVGFTGGTEVGDYRSISTSDAHAWVEAWFPGAGWTTFDPTPLTDGRGITPPYVLEATAGAAGNVDLGAADDLTPGAPADRGPDAEPTAPESRAPEATAPEASGTGVTLWPLAMIAVVTLLALGAIGPLALRARSRRTRLSTVDAGGPEAASAGWAEVLADSTDRGVPARPSDTVRATARRLVREHRLDDPAQQVMRDIVSAVESSWYGTPDLADATGPGGPPNIGPAIAGPVRAVSAAIAASRPLTLRERLLPRSVVQFRSALRATPARTDAGNALPSGR